MNEENLKITCRVDLQVLLPLSSTNFVAGKKKVETSHVSLLYTDVMGHFETLEVYSRSVGNMPKEEPLLMAVNTYRTYHTI
jgi:hypothetical protein